MRIVYLHQYFRSLDTAGGTRSYEVARRLVAQGHEVHLLSTLPTGEAGRGRWRHEVLDGIQLHRVGVDYGNAMGFAARLRAFARFAVLSASRAAALRPDLVYASSTPLTIALPGAWASWRRRAPMVFEVRDLWPEVPIALGALRARPLVGAARLLERFAYRRSSAVVALSPGMRDGVVASGVPPERVHVVPNASDLDLFDVPAQVGQAFRREHDWLGERQLVLYAGTLGQANGLSHLVDLAHACSRRDPELRFLLLGDGGQREQLRARAARAGVLAAALHLQPPCSKAQLPAVLSAATVCTSFVVPVKAMEDNSANKVFDALAAGRPLVINHGGWQAELIERYGVGLRLHGTDPDADAERLLAFLGDPEQVRQAGVRARRLAEECFDRDVLTRRIEQVLVQVLQDAAAGRRRSGSRARSAPG